MKKITTFLGIMALLVVIGCTFYGCDELFGTNEKENSNGNSNSGGGNTSKNPTIGAFLRSPLETKIIRSVPSVTSQIRPKKITIGKRQG